MVRAHEILPCFCIVAHAHFVFLWRRDEIIYDIVESVYHLRSPHVRRAFDSMSNIRITAHRYFASEGGRIGQEGAYIIFFISCEER